MTSKVIAGTMINMKFVKLNTAYEKWLRTQVSVIEKDLTLKHERMIESPFLFLRATFFRWSQLWIENMQQFSKAPKILAIGDLHIENFGTWRDFEGRLIWGVNDFDEACEMPYAIDLVRLAASAQIASACDHLKIKFDQIVDCILDSYELGLKEKGRPFVLEESHSFLREIATHSLRDPVVFWHKIDGYFPNQDRVPEKIKKLLTHKLPREAKSLSFAHRSAGLGSLGRPRYLVRAEVCGGQIVRETKALCPSAYLWAKNKKSKKLFYSDIMKQAARMQDPILSFEKNWVVRRLAPHCTKIEIASLPRKLDEIKLLKAMGAELANIHTLHRKEILKDFKSRKKSEWKQAILEMVELTMMDWKEFKKDSSST